MMKLIDRNNDVVLGNEDLELIHTIKKLPAKMGVTTNFSKNDVKIDMNVCISKGSGMLQINQLLPLHFLYSEGHGAGTTGSTWQKHHLQFAEFINRYSTQRILEVGGGHGKLAKINLEKNVNAKSWLILEPSFPSDLYFDDDRVELREGFFDQKFSNNNKDNFDTIINSHLFEHLYDPLEFLDFTKNVLLEKGLVLMSVPNLEYMLKNKYPNALMFEHTYFASEDYIEIIFQKKNFKLLDKKYFENHSIFFAFENKSLVKKNNNFDFDKLYKKNKFLYLTYAKYLEEYSQKINMKIRSLEKNNVYIFGAHIFSQILFSTGVNENNFKCVLDNDVQKHNKRLYGTNLIVYSPKILTSVKKPLVILNAGAYNKEIKAQIIETINIETQFISSENINDI